MDKNLEIYVEKYFQKSAEPFLLGVISAGISNSISDGLGLTAQPRPFIKQSNELIKTIQQLLEENDIKEIIVGMPYNQDGKKNNKCIEIETFMNELTEEVNIPVTSYDERYSSVAASRQLQDLGYNQKKQRGKIDSMAAAFILQGYLDKK